MLLLISELRRKGQLQTSLQLGHCLGRCLESCVCEERYSFVCKPSRQAQFVLVMFEAGDKTRRAEGAEPLSKSAVKLRVWDGRHVFEFGNHDPWKELRRDVQNRIAVQLQLSSGHRARNCPDIRSPRKCAQRLCGPHARLREAHQPKLCDQFNGYRGRHRECRELILMRIAGPGIDEYGSPSSAAVTLQR
ncbi:hypothetical protein [Glaciihabitans sp. UYNi722]|uniref:hypothetical protein n=1 Tax=Glaciihabitans sp. UYNi722 TaxID=3156344 RepID=UPI0033991584